jgi:hypothetical protein
MPSRRGKIQLDWDSAQHHTGEQTFVSADVETKKWGQTTESEQTRMSVLPYFLPIPGLAKINDLS